MSEDGGVIIDRAERLRIPRELSSSQIAKLKTFKTRISDWAQPQTIVYDEPIIVCIKKGSVERCFDHFHVNVIRFEELIDQKRRGGYSVSAKDAVLAYMLVFGHGSRHVIAGFLSTYPEFSNVTPETVGQALSRLKSEGWLV